MATSPTDLDRLLADLESRRLRLREVAGQDPETDAAEPVDPHDGRPMGTPPRSDLVSELSGLGDLLEAAGAQLRLQRAELDQTQSALRALLADQDATDARAEARGTPAAAPDTSAPAGRDGGPDRAAATTAPGSDADPPLVGARPGLAAELTEMTTRLAALITLPETLVAVTEEAVRLVPGVEGALLVSVGKRGEQQVLARAGQLTTLAGEAPDGRHEDAPPSGPGEVGGERPGDELTVALVLPGHAAVELWLRSSRPQTFGAEARWIADMLAVHFRVATARALHRQNLEQTIATRQQIGEAVGVLVERRRMTPTAAFDGLVRQSQALNLKLREVARIVVETGQEPSEITHG